MNELEKYLKQLDESAYELRDALKVNSDFIEFQKKLAEKGEQELALQADLDRIVFSISKSFEIVEDHTEGKVSGMSWKMSGTQTLEDGSQIPLYWPDVTKLTNTHYEYFEKRYREGKNLYVKTEYGLIVYFGQKTAYSKNNDFKRLLFSELFQLSKDYLEKAKAGGEKNYYSQDFFHTLQLAFGIAEKSKLKDELRDIVTFIFDVHQNWEVTKEGTLRILLDLSQLMSESFGLFNKSADFQKVVKKNIEGAKELEKTHLWGAMYAINQNIAIEKKLNNATTSLLNYKAKIYEKLCLEAEEKSNMSAVSFAEKALRLYQQIGDEINKTRLEKIYNDLRGKYKLTEIRQNLPQEETVRIATQIAKAISESDERDILSYFLSTPWYDSIENIEKQGIELSKRSVFMSMLPTSILDKFGNTVDVFITENEKAKFNFWNAYKFTYQIGTQTMHQFFIEAYKAKKLNYSVILKYLESSWYNEVISRNYNGVEVEIKPIDIIKPGLKRLFAELDSYFTTEGYEGEWITTIDSLTLKIEALLRYICERLGIATFKPRTKGSNKVVMEKLLDDLLVDLAHEPANNPSQITNFDEQDRIYIKYVLTEKAGLNLRNQVAHGLMDESEYAFELVIVLFCIIIKLSKYKFENNTAPL